MKVQITIFFYYEIKTLACLVLNPLKPNTTILRLMLLRTHVLRVRCCKQSIVVHCCSPNKNAKTVLKLVLRLIGNFEFTLPRTPEPEKGTSHN